MRVSDVIHACSERYSSALSSPFHPTSSSPHSSSISCSPYCTSSTTLRAIVTLRTSPKRRWTQLTNPTSTQNQCCGWHGTQVMSRPRRSLTPCPSSRGTQVPVFRQDMPYRWSGWYFTLYLDIHSENGAGTCP